MINVFIPHRWNNSDFSEICALLDRTKFPVRDYSVPESSPFDDIDKRYNVDPQIQKQIRYASVVVCSNRPANNNGMAIDEIRYAVSIGNEGTPEILSLRKSEEAWCIPFCRF